LLTGDTDVLAAGRKKTTKAMAKIHTGVAYLGFGVRPA